MPSSIYETIGSGELRQGEVLSGLVHSSLTQQAIVEYLESRDATRRYDITLRPFDFVVVLSQDCDLQQDYEDRKQAGRAGTLPFVLFCVAAVAEDFKRDDTLKSRELWKQFRNNKMERYQYLGPIDPSIDAEGVGVPALGLDFKQYFTVPTELVYSQILNGVPRRARLSMPFAEHLSDRFFAYHARIALPTPHFIRIETESSESKQ